MIKIRFVVFILLLGSLSLCAEGEHLKKSLQLRSQGKPRVVKSLPPLHVDFEDAEGRPYAAQIVPNVDLGAYYEIHGVDTPPSKK